MNPFFTDYSEYLGRVFPGVKVQKLSVNTGRGCPNRDGTIGKGGCIYCNNESFTPRYCFGAESIREQLEAGKKFFGRKYPTMKYLAYFQSFTGTYGSGLLQDLEEASCVDGVIGIVVGTRPDCLGEETLETLADFSRRMPVFVEIGVESLHDSTLRLINRGHTAAVAEDAVLRASERGLHVGVHLIAGLPGENEEMMLETVRRVAGWPIDTLKLHQLQVLKGTALSEKIKRGEMAVKPFELEEYLDFCVKVVEMVPGRIALERFLSQAPPGMVEMPGWKIKNYQFTDMLLKRLTKGD